MKAIKFACVLLAAFGSMVMVASAADVDIKTLAPAATPAPATLKDFKGLLGDWVGPQGAAGFSAPTGGQIVGHLSLLTPDQKPIVAEIWIFRPEGNSVLVRQKHYNPELKDREEKDTWGERRLAAIDAGHIYLNNLTWVTGGKTLDLYVLIPGQNGAPPNRLVFNFKRVR